MQLDFDHHATTPVDPLVWEAMQPYFCREFGNPSSTSHRRGLQAAQIEQRCRERVAELLHADPREVIWTSGATESNNLAIQGILKSLGPQFGMVTAASEHRSVLDPARRMKRGGWPVEILKVDDHGLIHRNDLKGAITSQTKLVSLMWANNEIGTIAPMIDSANLCRERNVWLHSDITQAVGKIPLDGAVKEVDLLSFSSHKLYGPPGIGVLIVRRRHGPIPLQPLIEGGGQQGGLRSGTIPLPLVVGLTEALTVCDQRRVSESTRLASLRDLLWHNLTIAIPDLVRHTPEHDVLPHNLNIGIPGVDGDALLVQLRQSDLCVSSGAACSSSNREPSHVLTAIGVPDALARASIRFGLGRWTTSQEVHRATEILVGIVRSLRG